MTAQNLLGETPPSLTRHDTAERAQGDALREASKLIEAIAQVTDEYNTLRAGPVQVTITWAWQGERYRLSDGTDERNTYGVRTDTLAEAVELVALDHLAEKRAGLIAKLAALGVQIQPEWLAKLEERA